MQKLLAEYIENSPSIAYVVDPESGMIVDANVAAVKLWGVDPAKMSGIKLSDIETSMQGQLESYAGHVRDKGQFRYETCHRIKGGEKRSVEVNSSGFVQDGRHLIFSIAHDVTGAEQMESELRRAYDNLERAMDERTAGLAMANARLNSEIAERSQVQEALQQSQELLRELVEHQERIREDERKRIAREIHDELGQHLLVLRIDVSLLKNRKNNAHPMLEERVDAILQHIDSTMRSVRAIINNLRPAVLDLGLTASLEWQAKDFQSHNKIACEFTSQEENMELDDDRATVLFRVLQEALTNVVRHAHATEVKIDLDRRDGHLIMRVADNGVGMPKVRNRKMKSYGLAGIRERIGMLGGEFVINTSSDGTSLTFSIPL